MEHRMKRRFVLATMLAAVMAPAVDPVRAATQSVSTEFVEVLIQGVPLGSRYVMAGRTVDVDNKSDIAMKVTYAAEEPHPADMRAGYEPVPDAAWVSFEPRVFTVSPGGRSSGKLVLYIPDDPSLVGRRFQAMLVLRGEAVEGSTFRVGLRPRLLFSVTRAGAGLAEPAVLNRPQLLSRVSPYEATGREGALVIPCGQFEVGNPSETEMTFERVREQDVLKRIDVAEGEEPLPDPAWLEVLPTVMVLARGTKAELELTARLPVDPVHFGRTYVSVVHMAAKRKDGNVSDSYNKVRIVVPSPLSRSGTGGKAVK